MSKWHLIIDVALCHNCNNCFIACKDEHVGNDFPGYAASQPLHGHSWFHVEQRERGQAPMVETAYLPKSCNQCANAPCTKVGDGAVYQRDDGIVIIDPVKAKGKKEIVASCPYGAIWWNEEEQLPQKWIFDAHLLDRGWKEPRCAQVCPTGAIKAVKTTDAEMQAQAEAEDLQVLSPEFGTAPRIHYRNLHRYSDDFLAGTVVGEVEGQLECLEGVVVDVSQSGEMVGETTTDAFGEFKIDKLTAEAGDFSLRLTHKNFDLQETSVSLEKSLYLGEIQMTPQT
jgi:Fe-S-cluster-containing dehydrogenase component